MEKIFPDPMGPTLSNTVDLQQVGLHLVGARWTCLVAEINE